jgi:Fe-S cluster biogenesis protein NfuA
MAKKQKVDNTEIENALEEIRAQLQLDGGDIELVSVVGGEVSIRLHGSCSGCPFSAITLQGVVERIIKEKVPEIKRVIAVS